MVQEDILKIKSYQSLLLKHLCCNWKKQYLLGLKTAHSLQNVTSHTLLKVGDVLLMAYDIKNKLIWKQGLILRAISSRDDSIRSHKLKTANGFLKSTLKIQHFYPLELRILEHLSNFFRFKNSCLKNNDILLCLYYSYYCFVLFSLHSWTFENLYIYLELIDIFSVF